MTTKSTYFIPTYAEALEMTAGDTPSFYESKMVVDGYNVSVFNYRLAVYNDFVTPIPSKPEVKAYEMRGLTFVFNEDGSLFNRYVLLEKFFNLNQVPESMYSVVKNYKIKYVNNKEDGSIASFIKLPNGKIVGKSKMGFDNEQANGINRIYRTNKSVKFLVDWALSNDITAVFEYVAPHNKIVLRYSKEELILLRLRDNKTGKHLDINNYLDMINDVKVAPFEDDFASLDALIELSATQTDKEGSVVHAIDANGVDHFFKIKTPWYTALHGLLTDDIYTEHKIIQYILADKIDDILGQIPEEQIEAHIRINKIIEIIKQTIDDKMIDMQKSYQIFVDMYENRKEYALKYRKDSNFGYVMSMSKGIDVYDLAKDYITDKTKKLMIARDFLKKKDPSLFFIDSEDSEGQ